MTNPIQQFLRESGKEFVSVELDYMDRAGSLYRPTAESKEIALKNLASHDKALLGVIRGEVEKTKGKTPWFPDDFENCNLFERGKNNHDWNTRQKSINENIKHLLEQQLSDILSLLDSAIDIKD